MYTVIWSDNAERYPNREAAIHAAQELSEGRRNPVEVEDAAQRELLVYREGDLASYLFETRPGKTVRG